MKTTISLSCGMLLLLLTTVSGNDTLVMPNYEYMVVGTPSTADINEVLTLVKTDVENCPLDLVPPDDDWDAIAYIRQKNEELNATTKYPYIIRSIVQSNDTFSIKIEKLYTTNTWQEGKTYMLSKTNGHFVILSKYGWITDEIPDQAK